ncbi:hypothetical protein A3E97_01395 [Candidatus Uhrbacteria bacterium RIFCSPHIGHO2_12_FULL_47_12]|uniref:Uncharacterized protein n=1 Tax=Candidatus Uhrbacteria bacterium RIFCSPLOWO2_02_FULL_48_18 TaxID=1802408 RepID=A0A1F7VCE9_9BACT|nr:MAG: hypothetical protein A2839_05285 [Candidatus Uhrbacteria bacterium RIFCSPHIGHO2_01_FULL_47_10]OGL76739.1 MAG: hypothetical protein A3E97_01395 [Candidatus Uhrbacteria bacterium RIFCSPHIGHO2_12_FULL_47_12]OGL80692.1 MAG: hypothetical protein A3B20_04855 [Candidatus Uhrbacteria bacterium RIFCSPLOWO2_01_FULL_47_17]OGL88125.1 MAG: hypothetical protein A3I41_00125 [Candidatus Uhrbacteria bacterium RIFCSPLOWO2_02_FULL_48_18]OGL92145.1 MAG: hypothetical protein A3H12_01675 [Candidatus Uhrbacte
MIYCLMTSIGLTEEIRWCLFDQARELISLGRERCNIASDFLEGYVATTGKTCALGGVIGVQFEAYVESNRGKGLVRYLVRTGDLPDREKLAWASLDPEQGTAKQDVN